MVIPLLPTGAARNCGLQINARIQNIHWQCNTNGFLMCNGGRDARDPSALSRLQIRVDWRQTLQMQEAAVKTGSVDPL